MPSMDAVGKGATDGTTTRFDEATEATKWANKATPHQDQQERETLTPPLGAIVASEMSDVFLAKGYF
jgi:hypothetical protein